ncbi:hypothetical protein WJX84_005684, partial [Apatococcus fuscideae]
MCIHSLFGLGERKPSGSATEQYKKLQGSEVYLVSVQKKVDITTLWGDQDRAVLVFARSMGYDS